jgi:thymidylate kinase
MGNYFNKKKVLEFSGMPHSGKSTQIKLLMQDFKSKNISYTLVDDRLLDLEPIHGSFYEYNKIILEKIIDAYNNWKDSPAEYIVFDRGYYDRFAWPFSDYANKKCSLDEKNNLLELLKNYNVETDSIFLFMIPPKVSIRRLEKPRSAIDELIFTMDYLPELFNAYKKVSKEFYPKDKTVFINGMDSIEKNYEKIKCSLGF